MGIDEEEIFDFSRIPIECPLYRPQVDFPFKTQRWNADPNVECLEEPAPFHEEPKSEADFRFVFEWCCNEGFGPNGLFRRTNLAISQPFYAGNECPTVWRLGAKFYRRKNTLAVVLRLQEAHYPVVVASLFTVLFTGYKTRKIVSYNYNEADLPVNVNESITLLTVYMVDLVVSNEPGAIRCIISLPTNCTSLSSPITADLLHLSGEMLLLKCTAKNYDARVIGEGGVIYRVHKSILSARSTRLKKMFRIQDEASLSVDPEVLDLFLCHVYSGRITYDRPELLNSVSALAEEHEMKDLVETCRVYLRKYTGVERADFVDIESEVIGYRERRA